VETHVKETWQNGITDLMLGAEPNQIPGAGQCSSGQPNDRPGSKVQQSVKRKKQVYTIVAALAKIFQLRNSHTDFGQKRGGHRIWGSLLVAQEAELTK
jgi:hypothetical protein